MKNLVTFLSIFLFTPIFYAQNTQNTEGDEGISFIHDDFKKALLKAKNENKIVFLDAYTTWCGPCKMMSKNTFPDTEVASLFNAQFVNLKMDMEKGEGINVAKKYEVAAYPTLLFLDGDGQIVHKALGYHDNEQFLALGKVVLQPENTLSAWSSKYEKGNRDQAFLKEYALKLLVTQDSRRWTIAEEYLSTQKDWTDDDNLEFIYQFTEGVDSKFFEYFITNKKAFEKKYSSEEINSKIQDMLATVLFDNKNLPTLGFADSLIKKVYMNESDRISKNYRMSYYRMKGDKDNYAKAAVDYLKKYHDKADELSDIASTFSEQIESKKMLKKAVGWAKKAIKMDNSYLNNLTLANLYVSLKKKSKAQEAAQNAIDIAKKNKESYSEAEEILNVIK